jgi:hypothetical protein
MMCVNLFIQGVLLPRLLQQTDKHFALDFNSVSYPVYTLEEKNSICDEIEKHGFSVRCGLAHRYHGRQGMQQVVFECSKIIKFKHRHTENYEGEIEYGADK